MSKLIIAYMQDPNGAAAALTQRNPLAASKLFQEYGEIVGICAGGSGQTPKEWRKIPGGHCKIMVRSVPVHLPYPGFLLKTSKRLSLLVVLELNKWGLVVVKTWPIGMDFSCLVGHFCA